MHWDEMNNLYRRPYIHVDAFYQVSVHLANRRRMPNDGNSSRCLWQDELKSGRVKLVILLSSKINLLSEIFPIKLRFDSQLFHSVHNVDLTFDCIVVLFTSVIECRWLKTLKKFVLLG